MWQGGQNRWSSEEPPDIPWYEVTSAFENLTKLKLITCGGDWLTWRAVKILNKVSFGPVSLAEITYPADSPPDVLDHFLNWLDRFVELIRNRIIQQCKCAVNVSTRFFLLEAEWAIIELVIENKEPIEPVDDSSQLDRTSIGEGNGGEVPKISLSHFLCFFFVVATHPGWSTDIVGCLSLVLHLLAGPDQSSILYGFILGIHFRRSRHERLKKIRDYNIGGRSFSHCEYNYN